MRRVFAPQCFQQLTEKSIAPWRVMFIVLGVMTSLMGFVVIILMPDNPMSVKWLSDAEKTAIIQRVAVNQTGIQNKHFKWSHIRELVLDLQIWLLATLIALVRVDFVQQNVFLYYSFMIADVHLFRGNYNLFRNRHP